VSVIKDNMNCVTANTITLSMQLLLYRLQRNATMNASNWHSVCTSEG